MPRRGKLDDLAKQVGERIAQLREARGLTREKLSYEYGIGSKGYVSDLERGFVRASMPMLKRIADALNVEVFDLFVFPDHGDRHELVDATRTLSRTSIRRMLADVPRRKR